MIVSMTLRFILGLRRSGRNPGLVIAGALGAVAALQRMAGRTVGLRRTREVRQMRLLPGALMGLAGFRRVLDDLVQPTVPFRRHAGGLGLAVVEHPAALALLALGAAVDVVAVAEGIGADQLAMEPSEE